MFGIDWSPGWKKVARYAHYNRTVLDGAKRYLRRLFKVPRDKVIPPVCRSICHTSEIHVTIPSTQFIVVHIRREDFKDWCGDTPADECFASPLAYRVRVKEVQDELLAKENIHAQHFVFSSDDNKPSRYWEEVATYGWQRLAFEKDDAEMDLRKSLGS